MCRENTLCGTSMMEQAEALWKPAKGQTKSKLFFQVEVSSKKRSNEFYFNIIIPGVDLFFRRNRRHQKDISKLTDH